MTMRRIDLQPLEPFTSDFIDRTGAFNPGALEAATAIIEQVRRDGDAALRALTEKFDGVAIENFRVPGEAIDAAMAEVDPDTLEALKHAAAQIRDFHERQKQQSWFTVREDGALVGSKVEPLESVGIYVPGGRALYPSSVLMNALPAAVADGAATMPAGALAGRTVLVTAGPTVEPIDSVRYISNYSSGKMGYAIAGAAAAAGARVVLVSGPVALAAPDGVEVVPVKTARDMLAAASSVFPAADAAIFAAAVADLRPANPADRKLKKGRDDAALASVPLTENPDILATLAAGKRPDQYVVGFAAETDDVLMNAHAKLKKKNADMIVANQVGDGLAFGTDNNEVWLVTEGDDVLLPLMSKRAVAERLMEVVAAHLD
mgnify:CR=1 FL=1